MKSVSIMLILVFTLMGVLAPVTCCATYRGSDSGPDTIMTLDICHKGGAAGITAAGELLTIAQSMALPAVFMPGQTAPLPPDVTFDEPHIEGPMRPPQA